MYFKWSFCQFSFDAMFLVWNKMSFGRVFGSGTWLDRRCLAFICDIASLQESDIFPFNSVVTVWLDHCWYLVQDCALTVVWVCDDGSFSFLFFTSLVFAHLSGSCFYSSICNSTLSSPFKVEGPFPLFCQGFYHLKFLTDYLLQSFHDKSWMKTVTLHGHLKQAYLLNVSAYSHVLMGRLRLANTFLAKSY